MNTTESPTASPTCQFKYCLTEEQVALGSRISQLSQVTSIVALIAFTLGIGAALDIPKFKAAWRRPTHPAVGLVIQTLLNPFLMFALLSTAGSDLTPEAKVMAILISASPGGSSSNLLTYLAYGALEISVAMTLVSTVFAFGTVPLFVFLGVSLFLPNQTELTIAYLNIFAAALAASIPPLVGILLQKYTSEKVVFAVKILGITAGIMLVIVIAVFFVLDPIFRQALSASPPSLYTVTALFNVLALVLGYLIPLALRYPEDERRAIAYEVAVQNLALPLAVVTITFGTGEAIADFLPFLGMYTVFSAAVNFGVVIVLRFGFPIKDQDKAANLLQAPEKGA